MSNFYLDIIKDRLYTSKKDSKERRAAQTVMYEILNVLVRVLAPMTCYTAEEIWGFMPHRKEEQVESVMLVHWPKVNPQYENEMVVKKWEKIIALREEIIKQLEVARIDKVIGHSLNAKVIVEMDEEQYEYFKPQEELLMTICIVSALEVVKQEEKKETKITIEVAPGEKCERCWMYSETVGEDKEHPHICHRCSENLK